MRVTKEATVGSTVFTVSDDYLIIQGPSEDSGVDSTFLIDIKEAKELIQWLSSEIGGYPYTRPVNENVIEAEIVRPSLKPEGTICTYQPRTDKAVQTVELTLGDAFLGRTAMPSKGHGDGEHAVVDLGKIKAGPC